MHIALQGCLRARSVPYGLTADTGGHIKYLLELVAASEEAGVARQEVVVRRFHDAVLGKRYGERFEPLGERSRIVRVSGATPGYRSKEEMAPEIPAIVSNLVDHIAATGRPDVVHAHYADAGAVALELKRRLGLPFVFTGHSLGRVKAQAVGETNATLARRIATEDRVLAEADRIVVSSRDEAERQYGLYPAMRARSRRAAILLNPPGCDLSAFSDDDMRPALRTLIEGPLARPDLPVVLAIARPVWKKNLTGLVEAFAGSDLRDRANLVVVAGTREDIRAEEPEHRAVLEELLYLRDRHGLDGHMSMPRHHEQADIPAIYAHARRSGGVFANVAFNEPFGLTFLEAAAAGLPVVATAHGGPNDIVGRLRNGLLVDPFDTQAVSGALARMIDDDALRDACAARGLQRVSFYSWERHARDYRADLERLVEQPRVQPLAPLTPRDRSAVPRDRSAVRFAPRSPAPLPSRIAQAVPGEPS